MKVEFLKWGNSLALRVPKAFAQELGASGKAANMEVRDGKLVVEIAKRNRRRRRYTLDRRSHYLMGNDEVALPRAASTAAKRIRFRVYQLVVVRKLPQSTPSKTSTRKQRLLCANNSRLN